MQIESVERGYDEPKEMYEVKNIISAHSSDHVVTTTPTLYLCR